MKPIFKHLIKPILALIALLGLLVFTSPRSSGGHVLAVLIIFLTSLLVYYLLYFLFDALGRKGFVYRLVIVILSIGVAASMGFSSIGQLDGIEGLLLLGSLSLLGFYIARYRK